MLTGKVGSVIWMIENGAARFAQKLTDLIVSLDESEMLALKYYVEHGSFLNMGVNQNEPT